MGLRKRWEGDRTREKEKACSVKGKPAKEARTLPMFLQGWGWGCTGSRLQGGLCHADSEVACSMD